MADKPIHSLHRLYVICISNAVCFVTFPFCRLDICTCCCPHKAQHKSMALDCSRQDIFVLLNDIYIYSTSIKIIKNEVGCRDDTVPKTVGTRRHC